MRGNGGNGHRLVLFDIDGTLVSAGRVARDSILSALEAAYPWKAQDHHQDRSRYDFSGKTDPQIVRDLVLEHVGPERFESDLPRALELYLGSSSGFSSPARSSPSRASRPSWRAWRMSRA